MRWSSTPRLEPVLWMLAGAILIPTAAMAQSLTYGARGGLDLTRVHFDSSFAPDTNTSAGVVAGGFVGWRLSDRLAVRGEVLVTSERAVFDSVITDAVRTLDVPVIVRYRVLSWGGRAVHADAGFVARHVLDATETAAGDSSSIKDGVSSSNRALAIGGSLELHRHWTADVRYLHGLEGTFKKIGGGSEGRTRTVQISVEYQF